ncbi:MAG: glycoside hydrolase family 27 protein, partial [Acidobacteriaceae bacterium]|nr:glycoside hydrolase family 27 protein [Acidobacteriaceae bacterium]
MTLTRRELLLLTLTVAVQLAHGRASAQGLATTPPMGWNSWNHYRCNVSDALIRAQADAMLSSGMKAAGYQYVNIDDCWEGERDTNGYI